MKAAIYLAEHLHEAPVHLFVAGWTRRGAPAEPGAVPGDSERPAGLSRRGVGRVVDHGAQSPRRGG